MLMVEAQEAAEHAFSLILCLSPQLNSFRFYSVSFQLIYKMPVLSEHLHNLLYPRETYQTPMLQIQSLELPLQFCTHLCPALYDLWTVRRLAGRPSLAELTNYSEDGIDGIVGGLEELCVPSMSWGDRWDNILRRSPRLRALHVTWSDCPGEKRDEEYADEDSSLNTGLLARAGTLEELTLEMGEGEEGQRMHIDFGEADDHMWSYTLRCLPEMARLKYLKLDVGLLYNPTHYGTARRQLPSNRWSDMLPPALETLDLTERWGDEVTEGIVEHGAKHGYSDAILDNVHSLLPRGMQSLKCFTFRMSDRPVLLSNEGIRVLQGLASGSGSCAPGPRFTLSRDARMTCF
jgi:hypothetical protein